MRRSRTRRAKRPAGQRLDLDRRLLLQFCGSVITANAYRELDDAGNLTAMAVGVLADVRTDKNGRHLLVGPLRQSVL